MGNMHAYRKPAVDVDTSVQPVTQEAVQTSASEVPTSGQLPEPTPTPASSPQPVVAKKRPAYVHPFIEMINRNCSETEMINTLEAFCGRTEVGTDEEGRLIYEAVDQTEFIAPVLQVFSYCATNGKQSVVQWLLNNFVPLQVSYDNNFCYFDCLKWGYHQIADWISEHESFYPSMEVLENLLNRGRYTQFHKCMSSPYLKDDLNTYRFTFMHYINNAQFSDVGNLLDNIKQKTAGQTIQILDTIYPNPRLAKLVQDKVQAVGEDPIVFQEPVQVEAEVSQQSESESVNSVQSSTTTPVVSNDTDAGMGIHHRNTNVHTSLYSRDGEEVVIIDQ